MNGLGQALAAAQRAGDAFAVSMWDFVLTIHRPVEVDEAGTAVCAGCKGNPPWPCDQATKATEARAHLLEGDPL